MAEEGDEEEGVLGPMEPIMVVDDDGGTSGEVGTVV